MGIFDWLKGKKSQYPQEMIDVIKKTIKLLENQSKEDIEETFNTAFIKQKQKELPTNFLYQDVKNSEEFKFRTLALNYSMLGEYKKAIKCADEGLKINPKSPYLFHIKGRSEGDIGLLNEGISDLNKAIRLKPNFSDAFGERGNIKKKLGDIKGAVEDYEKSEKIEPSEKQINDLRKFLNK